MIVQFLEKIPPFVDTRQMIEVDRLMVEEYHIDLIQMMENAGRNLARLAVRRFLGNSRKQVVVLAGTGGNGGGALAAARHLHNWGVNVRVYLTRAYELYTGVPAHQLKILRKMNIGSSLFNPNQDMPNADLILDGLIGYSLTGSPTGIVAELIQWANHQKAPILSLDVPSGLDSTTGEVYEPSIKATATMTLALPKTGFQKTGVGATMGELYLADIGVPPKLYARASLGLDVEPMFSTGEIVRIF